MQNQLSFLQLVSEYYQDFADSPEEKRWGHIPAGFNSLDEYRQNNIQAKG